jgi:hypothetical protein
MLHVLCYRHYIGGLILTFSFSLLVAAESFEAVHSRAHDMGETPEGKTYEKRFGAAISAPMRDALEDCTKDTKPPYVVNLVFTIASDGDVRGILPAPQQPVSRCVALKLARLRLPAPPRNNWLVAANITIEE